jgi:type I restriction enzyme R subunit
VAQPNKGPEQQARDQIDDQLRQAGWVVQDRQALDPNVGPGVAVRDYPTDTGPMDYLLLVGGEPAGVIEAKREEGGQHLNRVEEQLGGYGTAELKHVGQADLRFHRPETLAEWLAEGDSLRGRLQ